MKQSHEVSWLLIILLLHIFFLSCYLPHHTTPQNLELQHSPGISDMYIIIVFFCPRIYNFAVAKSGDQLCLFQKNKLS